MQFSRSAAGTPMADGRATEAGMVLAARVHVARIARTERLGGPDRTLALRVTDVDCALLAQVRCIVGEVEHQDEEL